MGISAKSLIAALTGIAAAVAAVPEVQGWIAAHPAVTAGVAAATAIGTLFVKSPIQDPPKR